LAADPLAVARAVARAEDREIVARPAVDDLAAAAEPGGEHVVAGPAGQPVAAGHAVVAEAAEDAVVARAAVEDVAAAGALDVVVAPAPAAGVSAARADHRLRRV